MRTKSKKLILILGLIVFLITWAAFFRWVNPKIKQQFLAGENITHEADLSELGASISLNATSITMNVGGTYTLSETGHQECVFSSGNSNIAKCEAASSYATITGMSAGTTTIRVMLKSNYSVYKDIPVNVMGSTSSSTSDFSLSCAKTELSVGEEIGIMADYAAQEYTWTTSNSSVATISNSPYISGSHAKIITAKSPGTTAITAKSGSISKSVIITVTGSSTVVGGDFNVWTSVDGIAEINQGLTNNMMFSVKPEPTSGTSYNYKVEITPSISYTSLSGYQWQINGTLPTGTTTTIRITDSVSGKSASKSITVLAPKTYTVTYNANGGSGAPSNQTKIEGTALTLSSTTPTRSGYEFLGWSTSSSATSATYSAGGTYTSDSNATLYAVWRSTTVSVTGVSLNKSSMTLTEGSSETLTATISPSNATNKNVTWTSNNTAVATVSNGTVTAKSAGTATITVTTADGSKTAKCTVTVAAKTIAVTGVTLDKTTASVVEDSTVKLTATVAPNNATNKNITWSSNNTNIATVDTNGTVTARKAGTAIITVTTADGNKTANCTVTVTAKTIAVTGVTLDKTTASVVEGSTVDLKATVTPNNATNKDVTWASSDDTIAAVTGGKVTGKKAGTATITVKTVDGNKTANCTVTVTAKTIAVTGVTLDKTTASVVEGSTVDLKATVAPNNATNKDVTWASSDDTIAAVTGGKVTGKKAGTATITVKTVDGNKTASCTVTVTAKPADTISVIGVALDKTSTTINVGGTTTLAANVQPANATNKNVHWSSSDETIATVNNGIVTGKKAGTATITVTTADGSKTAKCTVTVKEKTTTEVDKTAPVVNKVEQNGDICYITATDADSEIQKVTVNGKDITSQKTSDGRYWFKLENAGQYVIEITDKAGNTVIKQFNYKLNSSDNNSNNTNNNSNNTNNNNTSNSNSNKNNSSTTTNNSNGNTISNNNNSTNRSQQANTTDASLADKILPKTGLERGIGIAIITISGFAIFSRIKYKHLK